MFQSILQFVKDTPESTKFVGDGITAAAVLGTLVGYLPPLAALATLVWTTIRIYETETVQKLIKRLKANSNDG